jgi:hypothetical protein
VEDIWDETERVQPLIKTELSQLSSDQGKNDVKQENFENLIK